ncbi:hypothetical protein BYT27DRAFT_7252656 [Phlegmacium glaucopus]|nr:hypothetical protein BYT27DRAFT_7252656 [Phlegmacium glaucopus]
MTPDVEGVLIEFGSERQSKVFLFDIDNIDPSLVQSFKSRLNHLGMNIDLFYSSSVTNIIANGPTPSYVVADKENDKSLAADRSVLGLEVPKPTAGRREEATVPENLKIWSTAKLGVLRTP